MRPIDLLQVLAVVLIWGLNFVAIKTAVTEIPPLALTVLRFLLVGIILTPFFDRKKRSSNSCCFSQAPWGWDILACCLWDYAALMQQQQHC